MEVGTGLMYVCKGLNIVIKHKFYTYLRLKGKGRIRIQRAIYKMSIEITQIRIHMTYKNIKVSDAQHGIKLSYKLHKWFFAPPLPKKIKVNYVRYGYIGYRYLETIVMDRHIEADRLPLAGVVKVPVLGGGAGVQHMALAQAVCAAVVPVFLPSTLFHCCIYSTRSVLTSFLASFFNKKLKICCNNTVTRSPEQGKKISKYGSVSGPD